MSDDADQDGLENYADDDSEDVGECGDEHVLMSVMVIRIVVMMMMMISMFDDVW